MVSYLKMKIKFDPRNAFTLFRQSFLISVSVLHPQVRETFFRSLSIFYAFLISSAPTSDFGTGQSGGNKCRRLGAAEGRCSI